MKSKSLMAILGCVLLWTVSASALPGQQHDKTMKTGKKGEITLTQPTKLGDITLQPGTYVVQHRVSGNDHFVRLTELKKLQELMPGGEGAGWYTYTQENNAGEVKCKVEPAGKTIQATTVTVANESGGPRVAQIAIKGEDVLHVL
jgi:hypothetical protein